MGASAKRIRYPQDTARPDASDMDHSVQAFAARRRAESLCVSVRLAWKVSYHPPTAFMTDGVARMCLDGS